MPLKNCIMVMLAGGLDMPSTMQMAFSSWNTGLPDSWPFFSGLLTRIILEASSSDTRKAGNTELNCLFHEVSVYFLSTSRCEQAGLALEATGWLVSY